MDTQGSRGTPGGSRDRASPVAGARPRGIELNGGWIPGGGAGHRPAICGVRLARADQPLAASEPAPHAQPERDHGGKAHDGVPPRRQRAMYLTDRDPALRRKLRRPGRPDPREARLSRLEVQAQAEFHDSAAGIVGVPQILVRAVGLAEAGAVDTQRRGDTVAGDEQQEVRAVDRVERLHAELDVEALVDGRLLHQAEVPLLLAGSVEEDALTELARLIGGPDVRRARGGGF